MARSVYDILNDISDDTEMEKVVSVVEETTSRISAVDDVLTDAIRVNDGFEDERDFDEKSIKELREHIEFIAGVLKNVKEELY